MYEDLRRPDVLGNAWFLTVRSADLWGMLGPRVSSQLPRQLDVSHPTTAATQSTLPSPPPHTQLPSLMGRLESTLRGEAKALPLLGHGCRVCWPRMAGNGANGSWPLLWEWLLLIQRRKRHKPNSSGISIHESILHLTWRRSASHDRPDRFWYRRSQKCILRFSAHAITVTHLLSLQDDRDNLASPEQTSDITSMMHTFIGIIILYFLIRIPTEKFPRKKKSGQGNEADTLQMMIRDTFTKLTPEHGVITDAKFSRYLDTSDLVDHMNGNKLGETRRIGISIIQRCRKTMAWETPFYQTLKQLSTWVGMGDMLTLQVKAGCLLNCPKITLTYTKQEWWSKPYSG